MVAWIVFALSGAYLLRGRGRSAFILGLGALFFLGALTSALLEGEAQNRSERQIAEEQPEADLLKLGIMAALLPPFRYCSHECIPDSL